jgi:DNA-binding GntR family transcriptional regulator
MPHLDSLNESDGLPASERVYRTLKEAIISSTLSPNTRLVEVNLAQNLQVSRTPVREALKRLLAEGYVARSSHGSLVVYDASPVEVDDAYLIREVLEGLACSLAAQRISPEELLQLRVIHSSMVDGAVAGRIDDVVISNIAFHDAIYRIAGNNRLIEFGHELHEFVRRFSRESFHDGAERLAEVVREHERMLQALEERDPHEAEIAAREHLRSARIQMARLRAIEALPVSRPAT